MKHTLIRRFTTDTHKLRRKDADGEDPDERLVPLVGPLAVVDFQTDALQHTQEKRAASGQEDLGILEPMNGSHLPKVSWTILRVSVPPTNPEQRVPAFQLISTTSHGRLSPFISSGQSLSVSLFLPPSPHHDPCLGKSNPLFHLSF